MSKILRVIQPRSRFPLQSSRADLPLAKGTISLQLQEPLALNDTCKAPCVLINVMFQSPLCELVAGRVLWPPTCLPKALFTCWTLLHVRHATWSRTKEPALPSPGLRKCNIGNPEKQHTEGKTLTYPQLQTVTLHVLSGKCIRPVGSFARSAITKYCSLDGFNNKCIFVQF